MEMEIARSSLNSTRQLYVCGCIISPRNSESFAISPQGNFTIGNYPNLNLYQFFGYVKSILILICSFVLTPMITPNFLGHINAYATATTHVAPFTDPTAWYGGQVFTFLCILIEGAWCNSYCIYWTSNYSR